MLDHSLAGFGQFAIATLLGRHVHNDRASLHAAHHLGCDQLGGRFAWNERSGDDDVALFGLLCVHLALCSLKAFTHHFGVTATARAFFFKVHLDELAAQRHHLIGHFGTCVVGANNGAQAGSGTNGRQAGYTCASNKDFGGGHFARSRNLTVEETTKSTCCFNHCSIAADTRHRGECVHFLGAAEGARQSINRQGRDFFGCQLLHQIGVLSGPQETNERLAFVHKLNFFGSRRTDLEDDVTATPKRCGTGRDAGARLLVG